MKACTIYMILNTTNGMKYIGCSSEYKHRKKRHLWKLKANQHHTKNLQDDYNKGYKFEFYALESIDDPRKGLVLEKQYIKYFKGSTYNEHKNTIFSKLYPDLKINPPSKFKKK